MVGLMKYYGIKTPESEHYSSFIWWIADEKYKCWQAFFSWPDKNGNYNESRPPNSEAQRAYKAIGYKCVELEVKEIK